MKYYRLSNQQLQNEKWSIGTDYYFTSKQKCYAFINYIFSYYDIEKQTAIEPDKFMEECFSDVLLSFIYNWSNKDSITEINKLVTQRITLYTIEIK